MIATARRRQRPRAVQNPAYRLVRHFDFTVVRWSSRFRVPQRLPQALFESAKFKKI